MSRRIAGAVAWLMLLLGVAGCGSVTSGDDVEADADTEPRDDADVAPPEDGAGPDEGADADEGSDLDDAGDPDVEPDDAVDAEEAEDRPDRDDGDVPDDASPCDEGLTLCGRDCVDLTSDPEHCSDCTTTCPGALHALPVCRDSTCGVECQPGWVDLGGDPDCEYACVPAEPPVEVCNARDDDCNGAQDDVFDCIRGTTEPCTTPCGTAGERICTAECTWECIPPPEVCDNVDQDCDGVVDDRLYEPFWNVLALESAGARSFPSFSLGYAADEIALAYVESSGATGASLGVPNIQRFRPAGGVSIGPSLRLATESTAHQIRAAGAGTIASFLWDTGDGTGPSNEEVIVRSALLGASFALGRATVVNPIALVVSASPAVARRSAGDLALTGWIETASAAATDMRLATVSNHAFPGVDALYTFPSLSSPTSVDLAISDDTVALVAWSALSEDGQVEVYAQLFDMTLEPESDVIRLTTGAAESTLPRVAASGGRFMVVWQEGPGNVGVAVVSAGGTVEVPAFAAITGDAVRPVVAPDLGGGFALAYEASVGAVVARLSGGGVPDLEALAMPGGHRPELTAIPDGGLVVAYESGGDVYLARLGCTP